MRILPFDQRWLWDATKASIGVERPINAELQLPFKEPEPTPDEEPDLPGAYDNISADGHRDYRKTLKGNLGRTFSEERLAKRRLVVVHQTATRFGTTRWARARWAKLSAKGNGRGAPNEEDLKYAETMALFERFWKVPYHEVSLISGHVLDNNKTDSYTYHAGGLNFGLSWAMEGRFPITAASRTSKHTDLTSDLVETGRAGFRRGILRWRRDGAAADQVVPHRAGSGNRLGDCGEELWREVVLPVAEELDVEVLYDYKKDSGLYIPHPWDDDALYDLRGRRIRI
jgi:hypothetical protein